MNYLSVNYLFVNYLFVNYVSVDYLSVDYLSVNYLSVDYLSVDYLSVNYLSVDYLSVNYLSVNYLYVNYLSAISVLQWIYACTQCDILERKKTVDAILGRVDGISNWSTIIIVVNWVSAEKQLACVSTARYSSPARSRLTFDQSPRTHREHLAYAALIIFDGRCSHLVQVTEGDSGEV